MTNIKNDKKIREPLIHITKRAGIPLWKSIGIRCAAIVIAFLFSAFLSYLMVGSTPVEFWNSFIKGSFGNYIYSWKYLKNVAVLLCISLAVTPAFRMKFWNIGANGQVLIGALASVACVMSFGSSVPNWLLLIIMFLAGVLGGIIWAVIPAICKALWNTNETLFTLMMNYIASYFVLYVIQIWLPNGETTLKELSEGHFPEIRDIPFLKSLDPRGYLLLVIIVLLLTIGMFIYLRYSKHGYEISVVGESENTARYIGINVKKVIIRTMILSGAICGLAGFLMVSAVDHSVNANSVGSLGFTAIMVSWLAYFNPLLMILTSCLIVFLNSGASHIATTFGVSSALPEMITGIILFFIIGCEFFINYQIRFRKSHKKEG